MSNELYSKLLKEMEAIDILGPFILKKGMEKFGISPETISEAQTIKVLDQHIEDALIMFLGAGSSKAKVKEIKRKLGLLGRF